MRKIEVIFDREVSILTKILKFISILKKDCKEYLALFKLVEQRRKDNANYETIGRFK